MYLLTTSNVSQVMHIMELSLVHLLNKYVFGANQIITLLNKVRVFLYYQADNVVWSVKNCKTMWLYS